MPNKYTVEIGCWEVASVVVYAESKVEAIRKLREVARNSAEAVRELVSTQGGVWKDEKVTFSCYEGEL